jgi:hypothetical protein
VKGGVDGKIAYGQFVDTSTPASRSISASSSPAMISPRGGDRGRTTAARSAERP